MKHPIHPQVISPLKQIDGVSLLGFGGSISGGDVDDNGYPDMIVSSFRSNKAFVYRHVVNLTFSNRVISSYPFYLIVFQLKL